MTLGSADLLWFDLFHAIDPIRFASVDAVNQLTQEQRVEIINQSPAVASEHFANRLRALMSFLVKASPFGYRISDYFVRIEFQVRGSPHAHVLLWLEGFPTDQQEIVKWIDSNIFGYIPAAEEDPSLHFLVKQLQTYRHTFTCRLHKESVASAERRRQKQIKKA